MLAGATGLVGSHVLRLLLAETAWTRVVTVGRRSTSQRHHKLEQRTVDFRSLIDLPHVDDAFCCLGTTIKQAGSQEGFRRVDHDYVVALAQAGLRAGATQFLLVSAVGADPAARMFYSRVKGETEAAVRTLPYSGIQIFRPSLLLGERIEFRLGERVAARLAPLLSVPLLGRWRRYRPIHAEVVASAMTHIALEAPGGPNVFEYDAMTAAAQ